MSFDLVVRGGQVADGTGAPLRRADVAITGDRIVAVGDVSPDGCPEIAADGMVVAPGFINVLSHAYGTLQRDPRGLSDLYQGVTTEVFGEGFSPGPVTGALADIIENEPQQPGVRRGWPLLRDFLDDLAGRGVGPNVASFVGADNLRMIQAGVQRRDLTAEECAAACRVLDDELAAGALGLGSALIYAPGSYASTAELTAYARVLARHDALYISHIRDEADGLLAAVDELIQIAVTAGVRAEIYHIKAAGRQNWPAMTQALDRVDAARSAGATVTADLYPYEAGSTTLSACIPPWFHEAGRAALLGRLGDPRSRAGMRAAIAGPGDGWENLYRDSGGAEGVLLLDGPDPSTHGRTLAAVAAERRADPIDTLLDLVSADPELLAVYFDMAEDNVRAALRRPWVAICSDAEAPAAEPPFTATPTHPRTYGAFARVLGRYVRSGVLPLEEAVHRMTGLTARNLRLDGRGQLCPGAFADLAIFDPDEVDDVATYRDPHRYAVGMRHVLVNGVVAFEDGRPTGALAGRALHRSGT